MYNEKFGTPIDTSNGEEKKIANEPFFSVADTIDKNLSYIYAKLSCVRDCICGGSDLCEDKTPIERRGVNGFMRDTTIHTNDICNLVDVIASYFGC